MFMFFVYALGLFLRGGLLIPKKIGHVPLFLTVVEIDLRLRSHNAYTFYGFHDYIAFHEHFLTLTSLLF